MKFIGAIGLVVVGLLLTLALRNTGQETDVPQNVSERAAISVSSARHQSARVIRTSSRDFRPHESLLAEIASETDPDRRSVALERAAESVADAALPGILDSLVALDTADAVELRALLIHRWAESDAPAAATWATKIYGGSARHKALEQVSVAWANANLAEATAWLRTLPDDEARHVATLGAAYEAARSEPLAAIELVRELPVTRERDDLLVHSISQLAIADSSAAANWAGQIPDLELQARLLAAVAVVSTEQNPAAAAALITSSLEPGASQDCATVAIVQRWTQTSPREAASWVAQFPDIPSREAAVQNLVALWTAQSPEDAVNWLNEIPEGPVRDVGLSAYAQALIPTIVTESEQ